MDTMKKNVWLLATCQALLNTGNVLLVATSALVGLKLAPEAWAATLPLALQFLASMFTTLPASLLMRRIGRRRGFLLGALAGMGGALLAARGIIGADFAAFCAASVLFGVFNGFGTYYRFAAADAAIDDYRSRAISFVMAGGVVAAIIGPNLASWTRAWLPQVEFAGSYLSLIGIFALTLAALAFLRLPPAAGPAAAGKGRPLITIAGQGAYLVALAGGALGYAIMAFVMTATPLAMHAHAHAFSDTALVIEWHVLGMFAPSFFTGHLIRRFGVLNVMLAGAALNGLCVAVNLLGTDVAHFWVALTALGVGWNFLFVGATTLLTETYREAEKARAQGFNDFVVFTCVTAASLLAGALQHHFGWRLVNLGVIPLIVLLAGAILWLMAARRAPAPAPSGAGE